MKGTSDKPAWRIGDVLALTQGRDGSSVYHGYHIFVSERDPEFINGYWRYGARESSEVRFATIEDIDRLIEIELKWSRLAQASAEARIDQLKTLRIKVKPSGVHEGIAL